MLSSSLTEPGISVNSCLRPLVACDGMFVTTVEGIGGEKQGFHPVQVSTSREKREEGERDGENGKGTEFTNFLGAFS